MILDAETRGLLHTGSTILEATAGNTGVGLALIGVNRGYTVKLFVPEGFAEEKCILMRGFGAEVVRTPEAEGMAGAIRRAREAGEADSGSFTALQFQNQANPQFHHDTTAVEIWEQMEEPRGRVCGGRWHGRDVFRRGRFLKEQNPAVVDGRGGDAGVDSAGRGAGKASGGRHRRDFVPETFHREVCDRMVAVNDEDAFAMVKRLAAEEGLVAGSSRARRFMQRWSWRASWVRESAWRRSFRIRRSDICRRGYLRAESDRVVSAPSQKKRKGWGTERWS